jgi:diguanylate cyclase (GGDEF)-like protein
MSERLDNEQQTAASTGFFQNLASGVPGVLFAYWLSADGQSHRFPFVSDQVQVLFGADPATLRGNADAVFAMIHPEDAGEVFETLQESARTLNPWRYRARLKGTTGDYLWYEAHARPERRPDGSTVWYGQFYNIQHSKDLEQTLRESQSEFSFQAGFQKLIAYLSAEFINLGFGSIDQCVNELLKSIGEFFEVDRAYLYVFSEDYSVMCNTHEWCKEGVPSLIHDQQNLPIENLHWWHEQINGMVTGNRVVFIEDVDELPQDASDERALLERQGVSSMICAPVRTGGRVTGFFGVDSLRRRSWRKDQPDLLIIVSGLLSGALERRRLEEELLNQSIRDPLTGLHNRRYLIPRLEEMLGRHERLGEPFALAVLDMDRFKAINDSMGHLGGDYILQRFAAILIGHTRPMDVVARYGGEEFVVAFSAVAARDVRPLVARILAAVRDEIFVFGDQDLRVTVSAGIVGIDEFKASLDDPDPLISLADQRLYRAKKAGRDCLVDVEGIFRN